MASVTDQADKDQPVSDPLGQDRPELDQPIGGDGQPGDRAEGRGGAAASPRWRADTLAVRAGIDRSSFEEMSEAIFLTSGFVYSSAEAAVAAFDGEVEHFVYSRYGNPTIAVFEERMRAIEGAEACFATGSGMAAVFVTLAALCPAGSRIVAASGLFGSNYVIIDEILPRWGVESTFVDGTDLEAWREALSQPATAVFFETPSNPMQELVDIEAVCELAHAAGAKVVIDNVFGTPIYSKPLKLGADVVVYSATKHIDGQGRVLGGAILGDADFVNGPVQDLIRHTGPAMSPFTAWVLLKGLETLSLRVHREHESSVDLAEALEAHPRVEWVRHPWLPSHPQHELAKRQMTGGGTVVTVAIKGGRDEAFAFMNGLRLLDISNNLGDAKSMVTHPATTTHKRMSPEAREAIGITEGTLRISVGLEDPQDIIDDVIGALDRL